MQNQFLAQLQFQPVADLLELNRQFWHWVETAYHQRAHSALQDQSPADRFAKAGISLRTLPKDADVPRLFLMRQERRVRKDATICLGARLWEVPAHLRGQVITVWFDPVHWTRVELWWRGRFLGQAIVCNKQLNSQLRSSNDYHRFDS